MRYFIVTYYKKPNGQIDEAVSIAKKVKVSDQQTASVIMDFKEKKVMQCTVDGKKLDTDWDSLFGYYNQHYPTVMQRLLQEAA